MDITEKLGEQFKAIHKVLWIILLPAILDIGELYLFERIFQWEYMPVTKFFSLKLGFISAPPSIRYILEDFPSLIFQYNTGTFRGVITQINLTNILLLLSVVLVTSFLDSGYLAVISQAGRKRVTCKNFLIEGNRFWFKFFILALLNVIPILLALIKKEFAYFSLVTVVFVYVKYSIVVDNVSLKDNFKLGISFLFNNLWLSFKMGFSFGFLFSLVGISIYFLTRTGFNGIVIGSMITAYFGAVMNKAVLEIYRETSEREISEKQNETIQEIS